LPTKIGTLAFGTYAAGPGLAGQNHLIYAVNAKTWWFFVITSAADTPGTPGTHAIKSYYSSSQNLFTATWTAGIDSPNFDGTGNNGLARFDSGRALGVLYWNNGGGTKKDIVLMTAGMQSTDKLTGGTSYQGFIRASLTANTITWGNWGGYSTPPWNNLAGHTFQAGSAIGRTADGYIQTASMYLHSEVDAAVVTSVDPDIGDTWNEGALNATGNHVNGSAVITGMSNQTRLEVGMALSSEGTDWNICRYPRVISIDSPTQVTMSHTAQVTVNGVNLRWWQGTGGSNRVQLDTPMIDTSMPNECQCYGFAPLDNNGMLAVYDSGAGVPPNFTELLSIKANQTQAQGFWPATSAPGTAVFGSSVTNDIQDWCLVWVDTQNIFCARRTSNTAIAVRQYNTGANTWAATPSQPPAFGGVIKAGGGVVGVTNNVDFWLFVIDGTNNVISSVKYNAAFDTWGAWTTVSAVDSTAKYLSCSLVLGPATGVLSQAGLIYQVTNGGSFDAYVAPFLAGDPPDWENINTRPSFQYQRGASFSSGVR
jgi:hypothetical protein